MMFDPKEYAKRYYQENKEKLQEQNKLNYQQNKVEYKLRASNFASTNPELVRGYKRKYKKNNPDKNTQHTAIRRARQLKSTIKGFTTDQLITRFRTAFKCQCAYCKTPLVYSQVEWDHVIAIAKGGEHSLRNLVPACAKCNNSKHSKPVLDWLKTNKLKMPYWLFSLLTEEWFILAYAEQFKK